MSVAIGPLLSKTRSRAIERQGLLGHTAQSGRYDQSEGPLILFQINNLPGHTGPWAA